MVAQKMNCISCGKTDFEIFADTSGLDLPVYRCKNCKLLVTGEPGDSLSKKLSELYAKQYWDDRRSSFSIESNYSDVDSQGKFRNWLSQYKYCLSYLSTRKKILELGAGAGQSLYWFEKEGFLITGVEPDKRNVDLINQKLQHGRCVASYVDNLNLKERFNVIWMSHVLEHLQNPLEILTRLLDNLEEDGIIFIEVPNCQNQKMLKVSINEPHVFHFSKSSLVSFAKRCGFKVERCDLFRPATKLEGAIHKILKKFNIKSGHFQFYPRIMSNENDSRDLRIILKHNNS